MLLPDERSQIVEFSRRMQADELTVATSGNISIRSGDLVSITPSGVSYETLTPDAICVINLNGDIVEGRFDPSSEVPMHTLVYQHTDAKAVVHTHPLYGSTLSTLVDEVPAIHYLIALFGGPVRVAPYATYGSRELAENSVRALDGRCAVLLQNHGATTYGENLGAAYTRSVYLEWVCRIYYQARLLGDPHLLPTEEIERVAEKLARYGQPTDHPYDEHHGSS